jgi:hypothetical protein
MRFLFIFSAVVLIASSSFKTPKPTAISHESWNFLLKKHVSTNGNVNYKGFAKDSVALNAYLKLLSANPPDEKSWSVNEKIAYWINAYNAFTIQLMIRNYPLKSIKDIFSPWDRKFFSIGGKKISLGHIEHEILRKKFAEPRIHFAIVCASISCPKLLNQAYDAKILNNQLEKQAFDFINDPKRNLISAEKAQLSEIFSWFSGDFTKKGTLQDYVNQYSKVKINNKTKITYLNYNWNINE